MRRLKHHPGHVYEDETDTREYKKHDYDNFFVGGKRYKVRLSGSFDIEQTREYGFGELVFETTDLPFSESIGTTADIEREGLSAVQARWGFGMGLQAVDETLKYEHSTTAFRIFNAGNVEVNPFEHDLKIAIEGVSNGYELENLTTGDVFKVTESMSGNLDIDGATVTNNGLQAFRKTNRRFITLAPGWNYIRQNRAVKTTWDFRFYYK